MEKFHPSCNSFLLRYVDFGMRGVAISIGAPDMNAVAERFVGSVRREALDHFLLINRSQIKAILTEYIG